MSSDFEIYNNIIAILFSFYVFLTFTERKRYISNLAAGFALYLIALSMFVFNDFLVELLSEFVFLVMLKSFYFSAPFFIYNALSEFTNKSRKTAWSFLLIASIVWIIISGIFDLPLLVQLIPLIAVSSLIYIYTIFIVISYKQVGMPSRLLVSLVLAALLAMFFYVPFVITDDIFEFINLALRNSILAVIALMVSLIMMYFQKVRAILIEQQLQIEYLNFHDDATGLYNRLYFDKQRDVFIKNGEYPISAIVIDATALSILNSKYGVFSNDHVLKDAAIKFSNIKKNNETLFKFGSEEIFILMQGADLEQAKQRAKQFHSAIVPDEDAAQKGFLFGTATVLDYSYDIDMLVEESLSNLYINKLVNNKNYISSFISYFSSRIHRHEGKSDARLEKFRKLAVNIGYKAGLDEKEMGYLKTLCEIYDIGKISIPLRILEKKGALTEDEWKIVKEYPSLSYDIVNTVYEDQELAEAARSVRERWDGKGYPKSLKDNKIPKVSRIINIVESFDSMTNNEIYGEKKTTDEALIEILKNRGTQFDPLYVDLFVEYIKDKCSV